MLIIMVLHEVVIIVRYGLLMCVMYSAFLLVLLMFWCLFFFHPGVRWSLQSHTFWNWWAYAPSWLHDWRPRLLQVSCPCQMGHSRVRWRAGNQRPRELPWNRSHCGQLACWSLQSHACGHRRARAPSWLWLKKFLQVSWPCEMGHSRVWWWFGDQQPGELPRNSEQLVLAAYSFPSCFTVRLRWRSVGHSRWLLSLI